MKRRILMGLAIVAAIGLVACGGGDGGGGGSTGTVQGTVKDASGQPVALATITVVGQNLSAVTDLAGLYQIESIPAGARTTLKTTAPNYVDSNRTLTIAGGQTVFAGITMLTPGATGTVNASVGGTVVDNTTGASVTIDAGSLAMVIKSTDAQGKTVVTKAPISGDVEVGVANLSPSSEAFPGFEAVSTTDPEEVSLLESYGAMSCVVKQNGISLDAEFTGTATVQIPTEQVAAAPDTIDFWAFNETRALWEKTGTGTKTTCNGIPCYSGAVTHCSDWNADIEIESTCIWGIVVDAGGNPVEGVEVVAEGSTYAGSDSAITNADGVFVICVKFNLPPIAPEQFYVYATGASGRGPMVGPADASTEQHAQDDPQDIGTILYEGEATIDWTQISKFTEIFGEWNQEDLNLDLHVTCPGGYHVYFDSPGSQVAAPYLLLMNDAGCDPVVGSCFPGSEEEVRGYYDLPVGTYNVYMHRRDGTALPKPADDEITVLVYVFDFVAAMAGDTHEPDIMDFFYYDYIMTTTDPGTNNAWHAFQIDVSDSGAVTFTPIDQYLTVSSPADF